MCHTDVLCKTKQVYLHDPPGHWHQGDTKGPDEHVRCVLVTIIMLVLVEQASKKGDPPSRAFRMTSTFKIHYFDVSFQMTQVCLHDCCSTLTSDCSRAFRMMNPFQDSLLRRTLPNDTGTPAWLLQPVTTSKAGQPKKIPMVCKT